MEEYEKGKLLQNLKELEMRKAQIEEDIQQNKKAAEDASKLTEKDGFNIADTVQLMAYNSFVKESASLVMFETRMKIEEKQNILK